MGTRLYLPGVLNDQTRPNLTDEERVVLGVGPTEDPAFHGQTQDRPILRALRQKSNSGVGEYVGVGVPWGQPHGQMSWISDPLGGAAYPPLYPEFDNRMFPAQYFSRRWARVRAKAVGGFSQDLIGNLDVSILRDGRLFQPWPLRPMVGKPQALEWPRDEIGSWRFPPRTAYLRIDENQDLYYWEDPVPHALGPEFIWPTGLYPKDRLLITIETIGLQAHWTLGRGWDMEDVATPVFYPSDSGDDLPDIPFESEHGDGAYPHAVDFVGASWVEFDTDLEWEEPPERLGRFSLRAVIIEAPPPPVPPREDLGDIRMRHHRLHDHRGADSAQFVMLDRRVGPYEENTPVQVVLEDLWARFVSYETYDHGHGKFTLDAVVLAPGATIDNSHDGLVTRWAVFTLKSWVKATMTGSFVLDACIVRGGTFTLDAVIRQADGRFTLGAVVA